MQNAAALLLTLILFFLPGHSYAEEFHPMKRGEAMDANFPLTIHTLPEDKAYSEFMHQLNGIFVLLLGLLAFLEHRLPDRGLLRWGWPLLFLVSGIFLVVQSDRGSWPIGEKGFIESLPGPHDTSAQNRRDDPASLESIGVFSSGRVAAGKSRMGIPVARRCGRYTSPISRPYRSPGVWYLYAAPGHGRDRDEHRRD